MQIRIGVNKHAAAAARRPYHERFIVRVLGRGVRMIL
jgi:hypothetical protein